MPRSLEGSQGLIKEPRVKAELDKIDFSGLPKGMAGRLRWEYAREVKALLTSRDALAEAERGFLPSRIPGLKSMIADSENQLSEIETRISNARTIREV